MDVSQAFDCLLHSLLIIKLQAFGFSMPASELMADYLKRRKQRLKIGNCRSWWADLHYGLPQSSILGSVLFNIFINDCFDFINICYLYNYVDYNSLPFDASSLQTVLDNLQEDCERAIQWFGGDGMKATRKSFNLCHYPQISMKWPILNKWWYVSQIGKYHQSSVCHHWQPTNFPGSY